MTVNYKLPFVSFLLFLIVAKSSSYAASPRHHNASRTSGAADQYIETASELSSRARANVYFKNPQSVFRGVQFSFVNVGEGNLTFLRRDLVVSGRIPMVLARVYDSANPGSPDFGPGWLLSAAEHLVVENGKAELVTENASTITFVQSSDGHSFQLEKSCPSDYVALTQTDVGTVKATLRSGMTKEFKQIGPVFRLIKVTDRNGNELRLNYKGGLLAKLENENHFVEFTRDGNGRISSARDDSQRTVQYSYDNAGRLIQVNDFGGNAWTYTYTDDNKLKTALDPLQKPNFQISYDTSGRVRRLQLPSGPIKYLYDAEDGLTTVIDRRQLTSRFFQNKDGITTRIVNPLGEETAIGLDADRNVTSLSRNGSIVEKMTYDGRQRLIRRESIGGAKEVDRIYSYDPATGLLAGSASSDGQNRVFGYDGTGNLISATFDDGQHAYQYSTSGDLIGLVTTNRNIIFSANPDGLIASMNEAGDITSLQYKPGGELAGAKFSTGPSVSYEYQASGLRSKFTYSNHRRAEYTYDAAGNLTGSKIFDASGKQINGQGLEMNDSYQLVKWTLFDGTVTNFQYDPNGNLTEIRKGNLRTRFEYDSVNRLIAVVAPGGQRFVYSYAPGERSVVDQYQHSSVLVEDLRDTGFTFSSPLQLMATRPATTVFGTIRFSEELGTFELSNSDGTDIARPQANIELALEKMFLTSNSIPAKGLRSGFNIPFNTMFMPAEYASINCCPECFYDGSEWDCPPCSGGGNPNPSLTAITPSSAAANAGTVPVSLEGAFNDGSETVNVSGSGITVSPDPAPVDANGNANTSFLLSSSIVAGSYSVSVFDSGGSSNSIGFNITPAITSISPAKGPVGTGIPVTIAGAGFSSSASINAGNNISVSSISASSSTQLTATFTPAGTSGAGGNQSVTATIGGQTSGSSSFFDQIPTASRIVQTTTNSALSSGQSPCAAGRAGWIRVVQKILTDQNGNDIVIGNQNLTEQVTIGSPNDLNITGVSTGTATTNSAGQFQDTFFVCSAVCPQSTGTTAATQNITDAPPVSGSFSLSANSITYKCSGITVNEQ